MSGTTSHSLAVSYEWTQTKTNNCTTIISTYARNTLCLQRFPYLIHPTLLHYCSELPSLIATKLQIRSDRTDVDFLRYGLNNFTGVGISTRCFCLNYHQIFPPTTPQTNSTDQQQQQQQQHQQRFFRIQWIFARLLVPSPYQLEQHKHKK